MAPEDIFRPCHVFLRDAEGNILGGAYAYSHLGVFAIEALWVEEAVRRGGLGFKLYFFLEEIARKRGCAILVGSMFDLHGSRAFFEKVGGTCFASLPGLKGEREIFYVYKRLG